MGRSPERKAELNSHGERSNSLTQDVGVESESQTRRSACFVLQDIMLSKGCHQMPHWLRRTVEVSF
jgi:hypothetical protein